MKTQNGTELPEMIDPDQYRGRRVTEEELAPKGRMCLAQGCSTILSRYNLDDYCQKCRARNIFDNLRIAMQKAPF